MKRKVLILILGLCGYTHIVWAGLSISPIQLYITDKTKQRSATVTMDSKDMEDTKTFEATAVKWSQNDKGEDVYEPDPNIIINPKNFIIAPNSKQVIRVGFNQPLAGITTNDEKTWRIIFQEVAPPVETDSVTFLFNISVTLFVGKLNPFNINVITKTINNNLVVNIKNNSPSHVQILKLTLVDASKKEVANLSQMKYLLPNTAQDFNFEKINLHNNQYKLLVLTDKQDQPYEYSLKE